MKTLRNSFTLLSLTCYIVESIVLVGLLELSFARQGQVTASNWLMPGTLLGICLWIFAHIGRFLWNMNTGWTWKFFVATGALFIPISILLFDLNAKIVVSRLYTGKKPIPYTFLPPVVPLK